MTETVSDLLPCPFCGSDEVYVQNAGWQANTFVRCKGCNTEFGLDDGSTRPHNLTVAAWNRRTPPQNTDGEAVAWMHPTACWAHESRAEVAAHCTHGTEPVPLVPASALSAMKAERDEQHDIVARIWVQLGSPTYEQLAGCIHDLIEELQDSAARGAAAEAERDALAQSRNDILEEAARVADNFRVVGTVTATAKGIAAAIRALVKP